MTSSALIKYLTTYQFLDNMAVKDQQRAERATRMVDDIATYEEAHGHHLLERPHVTIDKYGAISITSSYTVAQMLDPW